MISTSRGLLREQLHFRGDEFLAHDLGVAALAGAVLFELELEEFGVHAVYLLLDLGPGIESPNDRTQGFGSADGGKSCDTSTDDQHPGWIDLAGRSYLARKEAIRSDARPR